MTPALLISLLCPISSFLYIAYHLSNFIIQILTNSSSQKNMNTGILAIWFLNVSHKIQTSAWHTENI